MCRRGDYKSQNVIGFAGAFFHSHFPSAPGVCRNKNDTKPRTMPLSHDAKILLISDLFPKWSTLFLFVSTSGASRIYHFYTIALRPSKVLAGEKHGRGRSQ
jgi:hypothetical protein